MRSLRCDALLSTGPTSTERMLAWIPLIGWSFAAVIEKAWLRPIIQEINGQLLARPDTSECWPNMSESLSKQLRSMIAREFGWPNDHFLPDDPFMIVFWAHRDGLDQVFAVQVVAQELGVEITAEDLKALWRDGTFGDFVNLIESRIAAGSQPVVAGVKK